MFERRHEPLLDRRQFLKRQARHMALAAGVLSVAWGIGILGYHIIAGLAWIDAIVNAAMILGGMGPVDPITTDAGKLFAAGYALFSGVVFLAAAGVFVAPLLHRVLHHFHLEMEDK
ncbi:MAG: hypothetical protein MUO35_06060 [Anaerolineales bacterium]|nr:hypothetical protein [Anaerolineales bacterium]